MLGAETLYFPSPKDITVPCVGILYLRNLTLVLGVKDLALGGLGGLQLRYEPGNEPLFIYNLRRLSSFIRAAGFRAQRLRVWVISERRV